MGRFNLDDYSPVEERIGLFYADHPEGRIITNVERLEPPLVVFRAVLYRDAQSTTAPWATGFAYEKEGEGHVNSTSYIENCETSAIGRALANAGYHGKRDGAPRPSREEMEKVERMGGTPAQPQKNARDAFDLDQIAPGKKANGRTWAQLLTTEEGRGFVGWALDKMTTLAPNAKAALKAAMESPKASATEAILLQDLLNQAANVNAITIEQSARIEKVIDDGDEDAMSAAKDWLENQLQKKKLGGITA